LLLLQPIRIGNNKSVKMKYLIFENFLKNRLKVNVV
jgi:hypothetical protein